MECKAFQSYKVKGLKMIPVRNIYYMLSYAFSSLQDKGFASIQAEEFSSAADLLAEILIRGVDVILKRGLDKQYIEITDPVVVLKGKLELNDTLRTNSLLRNQVVCTYDNLTEDSYLNRILKTAMTVLLKHEISAVRRKKLKNILMYFKDVSLLKTNAINWNQRFNRNNRVYLLLVNISYLIVEGLVQSQHTGSMKMKSFIDEQRMSHLYEKFILEYYRKHHKELHPNPSHIDWQLDNENDFMLPSMISDIMLKKENRILIIDAKFYGSNTQDRYDNRTLISSNLYQIFTYVKNKEEELHQETEHSVSGMLLYAKTDELIQPNSTYQMSGNTIFIKTLDLNVSFENIRNELEDIASILN